VSDQTQDSNASEELDNIAENAEQAVEAEGQEQTGESQVHEAEEAIEGSAAIEALNEQVASMKDEVLRAQAEVQNARRRSEQDIEKARKFALEKFVNELLPVADNLERAIASGDKDDEGQKAILEGVELTHKSLIDTLKKFNVEAVDPEGAPFDPQLHQAMSMVPNPDVEPNTVLNVFQKGYTLNGRLVRPAMVVVSSAPPSE
jgi:molecular chaperone GrpE